MISNSNSNENNAVKMVRTPTKRALISDLESGQWNEQEKIYMTRYGKIKRVRLVATIMEKREIIDDKENDNFLAVNSMSRSRVTFLIDDGTGSLWATLWGAVPEDFTHIVKGDLIDIVGILRSYHNHPSLTFEFIRKIDNFNFETYHILSILKQRKFEPKIQIEKIDNNGFNGFDHNIPETKPIKSNQNSSNSANSSKNEKDFPDKSDIIDEIASSDKNSVIRPNFPNSQKSPDNRSLNNEIKSNSSNQLKNDLSNNTTSIKTANSTFQELDLNEKIIEFIDSHDTGDGTAVKDISQTFSIDEIKLKPILENLTQKIKIYKVKAGFYSTYKD